MKNFVESKQLEKFFTNIPFDLSYCFTIAKFHKLSEKSKYYKNASLIAFKSLCHSLNIPEFEYNHFPNKAPNFKNKFVGSISHSNQLVSFVATTDNKIKLIGIDIEFNFEKCFKIKDRITSISEFQNLECKILSDLEKAATIFSIKEAFYKCYCSKGENILGLSWNSLIVSKIFDQQVQATYYPSDSENITSSYQYNLYSKIITDIFDTPFVLSLVVCT